MKKTKNSNERESVSTYATSRMLALVDSYREPAVRAAIEALKLPSGSHGLDAGCGIGKHTRWLAEAVGSEGRVTGVDLSPTLLEQARKNADNEKFSERLTFRKGDIDELPFEDNTFDWVWSADVLYPQAAEKGHPLEKPLRKLNEIIRVTKPGGMVALMFWTSQKLFPGYPYLEARLNSTTPANAPFTEETPPERHWMRTKGWLREAGLNDVSAQTFLAEFQAPLSAEMKEALTATFDMFWDKCQPESTPKDWDDFQRLCHPESPDFILNLPDYYGFITYSLFHGRV